MTAGCTTRLLLSGLLLLTCACFPAPAGRTSVRERVAQPDMVDPIQGLASTPDLPGSAEPSGTSAPAAVQVFQRSTFDAGVVPEASGIAASRTIPGRAYLVDDGLGLFLLDLDSGALQELAVSGPAGEPTLQGADGADGADLEDIAVGPCGVGDTRSCVYVGDIGDNRRRRDAVEVWRFPEPPEPAHPGPASPTTVADVIRLTYPAGPQDAEALLVDDAGTPLIISKAAYDDETRTTGETRAYRAPGFADGGLTDLGAVDVPEPTIGLLAGAVGNVVTGADRLGDRVLLRTYDSVLLLEPPQAHPGTASGDGGSLADLARWQARELPPGPVLPQAEAVALLPGGEAYVTVSERVGGVWQVGLPAPR